MKDRLRHYLQISVAYLLLFAGIILLISPIPIGIFFIATGLSLLIYSSETVQHKIHGYRQIHPKFNQRLMWVENRLEHRIGFISHTLKKTRPPGVD